MLNAYVFASVTLLSKYYIWEGEKGEFSKGQEFGTEELDAQHSAPAY